LTNLKLAAALAIGSILIAAPSAVAQQPAKATSQPNEGEVQGMSSERLARIAPVMKAQVDKGVFPGAVTMVARNGQLLHFEAHGFLDAAKTKPMTKDTLFRLASMTKPIVSVAAVMMIERGDMKLHDPVSLWLPELKDVKVETRSEVVEDVAPVRPILVHDLLRHTAGFVYAGSTKSPRIKEMYEKANIEARGSEISGDEMLKALGSIPLAHQPGTFWEYASRSMCSAF
jgi:CubicO group peptidase (beta-lactamase class C family)